MKKFHYTIFIRFALSALFCWMLQGDIQSQCLNGTPFGTVNAPTSDIPITITTCAFAGEYSTINNCVAGSSYQFNATGGGGNYITIRQGTPNGAVLGFGVPPITVTCTASGPLYLHYNLNASCGVESSCRTGTVSCTSCQLTPCDYNVPFSGSNSITVCSGNICDHAGNGNYSNSANGFTIINPAVAGNMVRLTFSEFALECCCDFVTVFDGSGTGGPILFNGNCTTLPPVLTSTSGPLTIRFTSDGSVVNTGFKAAISCVAPPGPCSNISNLTCGVSATSTLAGSGIWNTTACGFSTPGQERMYSFTPTATGIHTLNVTSTSSTGYIDYFYKAASGGCNATGWTCIGDIFSPMSINFGPLTAGVTYYLLLDPETTASVTHTFNIGCPVADPCSSITTLTCGASATATLAGSGIWNPASCGFSTPGQERIYSFTATSTGVHTLNVTSTSNTGYIDYFWKAVSGGCNATGWSCIGDIFSPGTRTFGPLTAGVTYYILLDPETTASVTHTFNIICPVTCDFTITCPPTTTVQCGANPPPSVTGNPTINFISGSCSPTITFTDNNNGLTGCNGTGFFIRTFTATFGSVTRTCNQTITKIDNTPPVISGVPANTSINCASPVPAPPVVTATDNCGAATLTYVQTSTPPTCGYTITRTWTATDACNNVTVRTQIITVVDNTPPVALCKSHSVILNAQGQAGITPADINNGSFDGCGGPVTLSVNPATLSCANLGTANVTLIVTDGCGLVSTCNAAVTVIDNYPPKMICRGLEVEINEAGDPVAITWQDIDDGSTDNCGITQWTLSKSVFSCEDLGKNTVKLTGADASGNASTCQVTVTVRDLIPPIFTYVPEDITVFCVEPKPEDPPVVYDNCGDVNLLMTEEQLLWPGGPTNSYRVRRHWTAMDKAGNQVEAEQLISVRTQGDLAVLCTPDVWTAASRSPMQAWWEAPRVSDACLGTFPMIQVGGPAAGSFFNPGSRTRIAYEFVNDEGIRYQCAFHVVVPGLGEDYRVVINQAVVDCEDYRLRHCDVSNLAGQQVAFSWRPHGSQAPEEFGFSGADARLEVFADGTARLQGQLQNLGGVVAGWIVDLRFYHRRNAAGWQSVGGKSFNPMGVATSTWDYFELDPSQSILIGTGAYAGMIRTVRSSIIYTAHGLQTGPGAAGMGTGTGAWVALATYNDAGKLTGQGEIRFALACNNTPAIMDAGNFLALDGQSYQVQWSNGVSGPIMGPAPAGSYQVQVTGPSGQVNTHAFALVAPTGCVNLWQEACRERNMAIDAQASQASTWQGAQASRAVDGNTNGLWDGNSVSSTLQGWQNYWQARLKESHLIQSIRLWPRTDCCSDQLNDHLIFVSANPIPDKSPEELMAMPGIQTISHRGRMNEAWRTPVGMTGQYVRVQLQGSGQLQLAEMEALVCQPDRLDPPNRYELGTVEQQDGRSDLAGDLLPGLLVWPNPAGEWVELRFDEQDLAPQRLTVRNLQGQEVYRLDLGGEGLWQLRLSVADWPQGVYVLTVQTTQGPSSRMIAVQR
jgi:hypothetical protein